MSNRIFAFIVIGAALGGYLHGQSDSLTLSSGTASGGSVTLALSVNSPPGSEPAGLQWTLTYPGDVSSVSAIAGPAVTAAGKTLSCTLGSGSYTCVAVGMGANIIANGVVASITFTMADSNSSGVGLAGSGVNAAGGALTLTTTGGTITGGGGGGSGSGSDITSLACNPQTLAGGSSTTCTVTLSAAAPAGGASVALSSSNAAVSVPASYTVAAGTSSGSFTVTTTAVTATASVTLTGIYGGTSSTASLTLSPPAATVTISSVSCAPATVVGGASSTCTVTLSGVAPAGGASVALSSSNAAVRVAASYTVAAGTSSGSFTATTTAVTATTSATLTASYGGRSPTASITLNPATGNPPTATVTISSLSCTPATVVGSSSSTCTVTLSGAAPTSGASVALSSSNAAVSVPASYTVAAGTSSGSFTATTSAVTATASVTLTASYGGKSSTASITLNPPGVAISSLGCTPATVVGGSNSTCTATLSAKAANGASVALSSSSADVTVPAILTVGAGASSGSFTAHTTAVTATTSVTLTGSYGGKSSTASLTVNPPPVTISSLSCTPATLVGGASSTCTATLSAKAAGGASVALSSSSAHVTVPATLTVVAGAPSGSFTAHTTAVTATTFVTLTGSYGGKSSTASLTISPSSPSSPSARPSQSLTSRPASPHQLSCFPRIVEAGGTVNCEVQFAGESSVARELWLSASHPAVLVPATVAPRANQSSLSFQAIVDEAAPGGTISIRSSIADQSAEERITVTPKPSRASAAASPSPSAAESLAGLPIIRTVANAASATSLARSGPSVCAPGSLAAVEGARLSSGTASDPSGENRVLAGTQVMANGEYAPVVYSSPERVVFVCPSASDGRLSISVQTEAGRSAAASAPVSDSAPGIFTVDGSGQAAATIFGGSRLAMPRNFRYPSQPAQPGDALSISVTGLSANADAGRLSVSVGGLQVPVDEVSAVPGWAGIKRISITIPVSAPTGDAVPIRLTESLPDGRMATSQSAIIAIEPVRQ